jgi:hypothetical protein
MVVTVLATFLVTSCGWLLLAVFVCRRVALHCRGNEAATKGLAEHVLMPIIGRQK